MAWNDRFKGSKHTPGEWRKGLTSILFRKVDYIDKRSKYGKGMEAEELTCAELIKLLDMQDKEINSLRSLLVTQVEEKVDATIQSEVGGVVDERIPVQPTQTKRGSSGRFERAAAPDNSLVGQQS